MKWYPKIFGTYSEDTPWGEHCIAFNKLDGSNLRFEFSQKRGWYKFGTRNRMFDRSDKEYGHAIDIFLNKYGEGLSKVMTDKFAKVESAIAYAEYLGPVSFGGLHDALYMQQIGHLAEGVSNDPKDVVLFDFNPHKRGFLSPVEFVKHFSHLHIPAIIYEGRFTKEFVEDIRSGKYPVFEGIVAKGGEGHKLWMRKVKTNAYLAEIRRVFGTGWQDHWE